MTQNRYRKQCRIPNRKTIYKVRAFVYEAVVQCNIAIRRSHFSHETDQSTIAIVVATGLVWARCCWLLKTV